MTYHLTDKEQRFINATDSNIINDIVSEFIDPDEVPWYEFYARYQERHKEKFGSYLTIEQ